MARYYTGPVSDHFDGERFFDARGLAPRGWRDLARWLADRSRRGARAPWPAWAPSPFRDRPPARIEGAALRLTYVGHASFLVQTGGLNLLLDPVWSQRVSPFRFVGPKRVNDPGVDFADLPPIDAALVSHAHYDHLDVATLSRLAATHRPRVITPLGNDAIMKRHDATIAAEAYDWHETVSLGAGVTATLVPTRHWSARGLFDRNRALWASFVIDAPAGRVYFVGDSGYGDGAHFRGARARCGAPTLAILPIGAYEPRWFMRDQHMDPAEATQAFLDCGADYAIAHHHGTFRLSDEAIDAPRAALAQALAAVKIAPERFRVLQPGEVWSLKDAADVSPR